MIQTSPRSWTNTSGSTATAVARLVTISSGRRRTRSASSPETGANRPGAVMPKITMPAAALLPVSVFAHTASASQSAVSPNSDSVWPATNSRMSRRARTRRISTRRGSRS